MSTTLLVSAKSLPEDHTLAAAAELEVTDLNGEAVRFRDLFEDRKTIVVFIREWPSSPNRPDKHLK
jgi:hypothetical protein